LPGHLGSGLLLGEPKCCGEWDAVLCMSHKSCDRGSRLLRDLNPRIISPAREAVQEPILEYISVCRWL
jgi:hypothetical protein